MSFSTSHFSIVAPYQEDRNSVLRSLIDKRKLWYHIDCHQNLRGPLTGTRTFIQNIVAEISLSHMELITYYARSLLHIAPELFSFGIDVKPTLTESASPEERLRYHGENYNERLIYHLVPFILQVISLTDLPPSYVIFDNIHAADSLDQKFISMLIRRVNPEQLSIVVCSENYVLAALQKTLVRHTRSVHLNPLTKEECLQEAKKQRIPDSWTTKLLQCGAVWRGEWKAFGNQRELLVTIEPEGISLNECIQSFIIHSPTKTQLALVQTFIQSACISDDIIARYAYDLASPIIKQRFHDEQAQALELSEPDFWVLGALPYHTERGRSPLESGVQALLHATSICFERGLYEAVITLGQRGRHLVDPTQHFQQYWEFTKNVGRALIFFHRIDEAEKLFVEVRALTRDPFIHINIAYMMAMIYTRFSPKNQRDHLIAKGWLQQALALVQLLPSGEQKAVNKAFHLNALALIEMHLEKKQEALSLVQEALDQMQLEVPSNRHMLYRTVLLSNRGQLYSYMEHWEQALIDFSEVIRRDPYFDDAYFSRAKFYQQQGQYEQALQDMTTGMLYGFPTAELCTGKANLLRILGRDDEALADYTNALDITPTFTDALLRRAEMYCQREQYEAALQDYTVGITEGNPSLELFYNRAHLLDTIGRTEEALEDYATVLRISPIALDALLNRATIFYEQEEYEAAQNEIERGLQINPNHPQLLCLRGLIESATQIHERAYRTFTSALEQNPLLLEAWTNRAIVAYEMGQIESSIADLTHALTLEENLTILSNRAHAYQVQQMWNESLIDYTRCLALIGNDSDELQELLYQRAQCYLCLGELERAYTDIQAHLALGSSPYQEVISSQFAFPS